MVLDDDEAVGIAVVVDVQRAAVAERDVALAHSVGFSGVPGRPFGKSSLKRCATGSGTSAETSPPNAAISFTPLDETKLTCGLAITYTVSTSGARWRLSWFIWNSHSKSEMTRSPLTIAFASHRCAKSTTSSRKTSISTFVEMRERAAQELDALLDREHRLLVMRVADDADDDAVEDARARA